MRIVNFNKLSIKNFLSIGIEPVVISFRPGISIITGTNKDKVDRRNAVGKSSIADALNFAIFGETIREIKKENILNNLTGQGCEVVLEFTILNSGETNTYKICRTIEPSHCYLYIDGIDKTRDSIINTTDYIQEILMTSKEIFQNCVIMTLNNTIPFMGQKKVEKRKFIESIFNLEVFSRMLSNVRGDYNDVKRDYDIEYAKKEESEKLLKISIDRRDKFAKERQDRYKKILTQKTKNVDEFASLQKKVSNISGDEIDKIDTASKTIEDNLDVCQDKLVQLTNTVSTLNAEKKFKQEIYNKIGTTSDACPVCLRSIDSHNRDEIDREKEKINTDISDILKRVSANNLTVDKLTGLKSKLKDAISGLSKQRSDHLLKIKDTENINLRIGKLSEWIAQQESDIKNIETETDEFASAIKEIESRILYLQSNTSGIKDKLNMLDVVKFIVSEEGVKSYIVRKILLLFNNKIMYYLHKMDANCCCIFNEYFEEEIVNEKGKSCSYFNFSGAERKSIDLACLFAFMDIRRLQGSVAYNVSVYDELLDSSLDERGIELVLEVLRERAEKYNECILIISHRKESVKISMHHKNTGEVIFLSKENGITRRVDFAEKIY